jgi:uncharacterized membrane protein
MEKDNEPSEETKNEWENDPNNWIWGMFYYNPKDKRLYFPKRIKEFEWHTNYVNPNAIIIVALLVAIILIFIKLAKYKG